MKQLPALISLFVLLTTFEARPQGVVYFNNRLLAAGVDAPVYYNGSPLSGDDSMQWRAALYGAVGEDAPESSMALLKNAPTGQGAVGFRTGIAAGYVKVDGWGERSIGIGYNIAVTLQVRVWSGGYGTYEDALSNSAVLGKSELIQLRTSAYPLSPELPPLIGLNSFDIGGTSPTTGVPVPEPSAVILVLAASLTLMLGRIRQR